MGRPTTSNANAFDRKQSPAQTHSDSAYPQSQASTVETSFTDEEMSMLQSQADHAKQNRRGRGDASIRDSRSQMYNSAYETQSSMHNVNTTDPFPPTEHRSKEKSGSGRKEKPLMGSLRGPLGRSSRATPPQASHPLPSVASPQSDYQHHSESHRRAEVKPSKSSYQANRLNEPLELPPSHSSPPKQSSRRSPESESKVVDLSGIYQSDGLPKSPEPSPNTEFELVDCGGIYNPPGAFPLSEGRWKLCRLVYGASEGTRADRNRLEGGENPSHIRTDQHLKELDPQDDLQREILGGLCMVYHGREQDLRTPDA